MYFLYINSMMMDGKLILEEISEYLPSGTLVNTRDMLIHHILNNWDNNLLEN